MQPAQAGAGLLVDQPVVLDGGLPAHPAQQAEDLHRHIIGYRSSTPTAMARPDLTPAQASRMVTSSAP